MMPLEWLDNYSDYADKYYDCDADDYADDGGVGDNGHYGVSGQDYMN